MTTSTVASLTPALHALLGDAPLVTLTDRNDPTASVSVRLVRAGGVWLGVLDDRCALLERARMGAMPRFESAQAQREISGDATVKLRGRAADQASFRRGEEGAQRALVDAQPFGLGSAVLVEVAPTSAHVDETAGEPVGALPRT